MRVIKDSIVKWGVLGAGNVCEVKSAPAMQLIPGSELVAVMRRDGQKAKAYAERHGVPKWYDQTDKLISDPEVNAIYIATPPHVHAELTRKAADAGKPVYVEKPMATNYQECLDMISTCERAKVPLFVAYYRRTLPNFLKIKQLVEDGVIGDVRLVNIQMNQTKDPKIMISTETNWRVDPEIAGGGYFYDLASHQLDFLDFLFGPIKAAKGIAANQAGRYPAEDIVTASFEFENGILGSGSWCFTTSKTANEDMTIIVGSKGQISYPTFGEPYVLLETDKKGQERFDFEVPKHIQYFLIESIVNELLGKGKCPSTGISAARTNWVMEQIVYGG
jgi:predicted dehydrogenase